MERRTGPRTGTVTHRSTGRSGVVGVPTLVSEVPASSSEGVYLGSSDDPANLSNGPKRDDSQTTPPDTRRGMWGVRDEYPSLCPEVGSPDTAGQEPAGAKEREIVVVM